MMVIARSVGVFAFAAGLALSLVFAAFALVVGLATFSAFAVPLASGLAVSFLALLATSERKQK